MFPLFAIPIAPVNSKIAVIDGRKIANNNASYLIHVKSFCFAMNVKINMINLLLF